MNSWCDDFSMIYPDYDSTKNNSNWLFLGRSFIHSDCFSYNTSGVDLSTFYPCNSFDEDDDDDDDECSYSAFELFFIF